MTMQVDYTAAQLEAMVPDFVGSALMFPGKVQCQSCGLYVSNIGKHVDELYCCGVWRAGSDERIAGVAIKHGKLTFSMPPPNRHGDLIKDLDRCKLPEACHGDQGFITSKGRFVDRAEAYKIAKGANQMLRRTSNGADELYSEDLW